MWAFFKVSFTNSILLVNIFYFLEQSCQEHSHKCLKFLDDTSRCTNPANIYCLKSTIKALVKEVKYVQS